MANYLDIDEVASGVRVRNLVINLVDPLIDAGDTAQAINTTVQALDSELIGEFNSDPLFDFRAQRPIVSYADGEIVGLAMPKISLSVVTDVQGENFLYLSGQEPDFKWESVADDIAEIVSRFGVEKVFSFASMPAPVPHTRPVDMLIRRTRDDDSVAVVKGFAEHFGSLVDVFEARNAKTTSIVNIRVRVPFYLVRGESPFFAGALAAVKMLAFLGGPTFPVGDLEQLEDTQQNAIAELLVPDSEFAQLVDRLERGYDNSQTGFVTNEDSVLEIPSSEEIGEAAEQFLAAQSSSPLDRVVKEKKTPKYTEDLRRIGRGLRRGRHHFPDTSGQNSAGNDEGQNPAGGEEPDGDARHE